MELLEAEIDAAVNAPKFMKELEDAVSALFTVTCESPSSEKMRKSALQLTTASQCRDYHRNGKYV